VSGIVGEDLTPETVASRGGLKNKDEVLVGLNEIEIEIQVGTFQPEVLQKRSTGFQRRLELLQTSTKALDP